MEKRLAILGFVPILLAASPAVLAETDLRTPEIARELAMERAAERDAEAARQREECCCPAPRAEEARRAYAPRQCRGAQQDERARR